MTAEQQAFVRTYTAAAVAAGKRFHLNPLVVLAQAAHESAWGTSYGAKTRRNFFGITAAGSPNEFWLGEKSQSKASGLWFRVYPTATACFMDFARLITSKYQAATSVSGVPSLYAKAIAASPYISETNGDSRIDYARAVALNSITIATAIKQLSLSLA